MLIRIILAAFLLSHSLARAGQARISEHARKTIQRNNTKLGDTLKIRWSDSSYSSCTLIDDGDGGLYPIIRNQRFDIMYVPSPVTSGYGPLILSQSVETLPEEEGNAPLLEVKAYALDHDGKRLLRWTITDEADRGGQELDFYRTVLVSGSGVDLCKYYRTSDGKLIFSSTDSIARYHSTETSATEGTRYVAGLGTESHWGNVAGEDSLALGEISTSTADSCLHVVVFRARTITSKKQQQECGLGHCRVAMVSRDSAMAAMAGRPEVYCSISPSRLQKLPGVDFVRVSFDCPEPVFIIPIDHENFVIDRSDFDEFEIVRVN